MTTIPKSFDRLNWWRDARFGMFIHWGISAIPAGEWKGERIKGLAEWIMRQAKIPLAEYRELADCFNPEQFDADAIARLAAGAGMKYLVFTAKHHDGFAMYHSKVDAYNVVDATPFGRDPVAELAEACRRHGVVFCLYYSQDLDWAHPDGGGNDWDFRAEEKVFERYFTGKCLPQIRELLTNYGEIGVMWFDMATNITREQSLRLRDLVHELQPGCLVSGRVGHGVGDYGSLGDNQLPLGTPKGDWETPATLNDSWGFKHYDHDWRDPEDIIRTIVDTAEKGVNYLLNIGPEPSGRVPPASVEILHRVAEWMQVHGEAIHGTRPNPFNCEFEWGRITVRDTSMYLFFTQWPGRTFRLPGVESDVVAAHVIGGGEISAKQAAVMDTPVLDLALPSAAPAQPVSVVKLTFTEPPRVVSDCCQQDNGVLSLPPQLSVPHQHSLPNERRTREPEGALAAAEAAEVQNEVSAGPTMGPGPAGKIENWDSPKDYLTWDCRILQAGVYEVVIHTMAWKYEAWKGGHSVELQVAGSTVRGRIEDHGRLQRLRNLHFEEAITRLGQIQIQTPGRYPVTLRATHIAPELRQGLSVSGLRLLPVPTEPSASP